MTAKPSTPNCLSGSARSRRGSWRAVELLSEGETLVTGDMQGLCSGAPSSGGRGVIRSASALAAACLALTLFAFAPAFAQASLARPFLPGFSLDAGGCGVTTDAGGDIYVANYGHVDVFDSSGAFLTGFSVAHACALAVDGSGNLYVDSLGGQVTKFLPSDYPPVHAPTPTTYSPDKSIGESAPGANDGDGVIDSEAPLSVSVDPSNQDVYVAGGDHISRYQDDGNLLDATIGSGVPGASYTSVEVYGANHDVYAYDVHAAKAYIFKASVSLTTPTITIDGTNVPNFPGGFADFAPLPYIYLTVDQSNGNALIVDDVHTGNGAQTVIDEFEASGAFVTQINKSDLGNSDPSDVAVDSSGGANDGNVYFISNRIYAFGPAVLLPDLFTGAATNITGISADLIGTVNPSGVPLTDCHFEVVSASQYNQDEFQSVTPSQEFACSPAAGSIPGDSNAHEVIATVSELTTETSYRYRLVGSNGNGANSGETKSLLTDGPPLIKDTLGIEVEPESATFTAKLDPNGDETTYRFEYGTDSAYGTNVPATDPSIGSAHGVQSVSQPISNLQPDTTYHYRVVATNSLETVKGVDLTFHTPILPRDCPNASLRSQQESSFLPDCRAWEQVSPVNKGGADIMVDATRTRAAADGSAAQFSSLTNFGDIEGSGIGSDYVATRGSEGWSTYGITPPQESLILNDVFGNALDPRYVGDFSTDLTKGVFFAKSPLNSEGPNVAGQVNLYLRTDLRSGPPGTYTLLTDCSGCAKPLPPENSTAAEPHLAGASADFGAVLFESVLKLTADAPGNCVNPTDSSKCPPKLYEWDHGTVRLEGILPNGAPAPSSMPGRGIALSGSGAAYTPNVISDDGSRAIFTSPASASGEGKLYLREDNATTVQVNASEKATPSSSQPAKYQMATPDGSKIFFTSSEQLTNTPGAGLYRYDVSASPGHHLTLLAPGTSDVIGVSDDGSYVYFGGISVWHKGTVHVVASNPGVEDSNIVPGANLAGWLARVSPNGKLVFAVKDHGLTGYDNTDPTGGHNCADLAGSRCVEVYYYDGIANGGAGRLTCLSCHFGSPAASDAGFNAAVAFGGSRRTSYVNHPLSADGSNVFFDTAEALVSRDTNGQRDVYEYDTQRGQLYLLTSGESNSDSYFMDAAADGSNAFILTRERLVGWDVDNAYDLYDARVNGGFSEPPPPPPSCQGDACQPPPLALNDPTPVSSTFFGAGNRKPMGRKSGKHRKRHHTSKHRKRQGKREANHNRGGSR